MRNFFLGAKHWKVFLATSGAFILFQLLAEISSYSVNPMITQTHIEPEEILEYMKVFMIAYVGVILVFMCMQFAWLWQVSTAFQDLLPEGEKLNLRTFKMLFIIPFIAVIVLGYAFYNVFQMIQTKQMDFVSFGLVFAMVTVLFPSILYLMYVTAKTIKSAEVGTKLKFAEFAGEFFLVMFFFIGVFAIQPRVNVLFERLKELKDK